MTKLKETWDLSPLLNGDDDKSIPDKRKIIEEKYKEFSSKWKDGSFLESPEKLKEALDDYEELNRYYTGGGAELFYFNLREAQDQNNPKIKSKLNKSIEFVHKVSDELRFFEITLSKVDGEKQKVFLNSSLLKEYKHFLVRIFIQGKYVLSEKEEKILSLKSKVSYSNWENLTSQFLSKSEAEVIDPNTNKLTNKNFNEIQGILLSGDNKIRNKASEEVDKIVKSFEELAEIEMNSLLEDKKIDDELRGITRPDFARHLDDDVSSEVVDTLIKCASNNFEISKRFYEFKAKLLGFKKFKYNDRNIEYKSVNKKYPYGDAVKICENVFSSLDKEFLDIFDRFFKNGQIDVFPRKGKRGGAFCTDHSIPLPTYILLNHNDNLKDVLTIAHEVGHGINHELMKKSQNSLNFGTPKSTAEVASTFMEDFVLQELLKEVSDEERFGLMVAKLQGDITTILRQAACYKFEQELHKNFREKGYLSKDEIGELFSKNMSSYLGDAFEKDESMKIAWVYWPHIRDFFYVYSYASGLLISKAMQRKVKEDKKFILKVKEFLSAGTSASPKEIFLKLGIDITKEEFWQEGFDEINNLLNETESLAKKLGKI